MRTRLVGPLRAVLFGSLLLTSFACGGGSGSGGGSGADGGGGGGGGGDKLALGEGPCDSADQCEGDVCVALIDGNNPPVYCSEPCSGSCPDGFFCDSDTFALAGVSFCRFGDANPDEPAPPPEEAPRLPCTSDDNCDPGLVCATFEGERECTIPCTTEPDCTIDVGGLTLDLHTCAPDQEPGANRDVCLPDPSCFPNVNSCIELPFP